VVLEKGFAMKIKHALVIVFVGLLVMTILAPANVFANGQGILTGPSGKRVTDNRTIGLTGNTRFDVLGSGIECTVHAKVTYDGNSMGEVHFEITAPACIGYGATFYACEVGKVTNTPVGRTNFEWKAHLTSAPAAFLFLNALVKAALKNCESGKTIVTRYPKGVRVLPTDGNQPLEAATLRSPGATGSIDGGTEFPLEVQGTLEVTGTDRGMYIIS
jgi:hypothetical protein